MQREKKRKIQCLNDKKLSYILCVDKKRSFDGQIWWMMKSKGEVLSQDNYLKKLLKKKIFQETSKSKRD